MTSPFFPLYTHNHSLLLSLQTAFKLFEGKCPVVYFLSTTTELRSRILVVYGGSHVAVAVLSVLEFLALRNTIHFLNDCLDSF